MQRDFCHGLLHQRRNRRLSVWPRFGRYGLALDVPGVRPVSSS